LEVDGVFFNVAHHFEGERRHFCLGVPRGCRAVERTRGEFTSIRTGRAAPALVEKIPVEYYGSTVPLQQLASFSVPEARMLLISPFDKASMASIERAIMDSNLGLNPSNDGVSIRLAFPPLTEERRKEFVRLVKNKAEDRYFTPIDGCLWKALWLLRLFQMVIGEVETPTARYHNPSPSIY
jgi:hypothetical protein